MLKRKMISLLLLLRTSVKKYNVWLCRKQICRTVTSYGTNLKINGPSYFPPQTKFGDNVNINGMIVHGRGELLIGNNFHSGEECLCITQIHRYEGATKIPYDSTNIFQKIIIEDNVWIGTRVTILGDITIGEGAIIQAGSTVVSDIPKYAIAGGHPARVFKYRDSEHYEKLKAEGKFH